MYIRDCVFAVRENANDDEMLLWLLLLLLMMIIQIDYVKVGQVFICLLRFTTLSKTLGEGVNPC